MATFQEALRAKEHLVKRWKKMPGVVGIGVGYANGKNKKGGACVVLYTLNAKAAVKKQCPSCVSVKSSAVGTRVQVPVRQIVSGRCSCHPLVRPTVASTQFRGRIRPVVAGYSVGHPGASGTAGLIVANVVRRARRFLLSNNHVLNQDNTIGFTETIQPGGADGGRSVRDRIGRLFRFIPLQRNADNFLDAAISIPTTNSLLAPRYATVGNLPGHVRSYRVGSRFKKVGRSTGRVSGIVESVNTDVEVDYGGYGGLGSILFRNQTVIRGSVPISLAGDSGSVWLTSNNFAAAVNFAGSADGRLSVSFPVHWAMQAFGIRVAMPVGRTGVVRGRRSRKGAYVKPLTAAELRRIVPQTAKRARQSRRKKGRK